jgi:hypothetical protein
MLTSTVSGNPFLKPLYTEELNLVRTWSRALRFLEVSDLH